MRTLKEAAVLLAKVQTTADLAVILPSLGFSAILAPLDSESVRALGLNGLVESAHISRGSGTLRALVVEAIPSHQLRDTTRRISERLSGSSAHILWLVFVMQRQPRALALAAWSHDDRRMRTAALVVDLQHIVDSDAETLCALAAIRDSVDVMAHSRWVELLGRDALTRRFYRTLASVVRAMGAACKRSARSSDGDELALLQVSRLLFLSFLEAKGWLNRDKGFLTNGFNRCMATGGDYQRRVLLPLFFGTLNTPAVRRAAASREFGQLPFLNGGLFARTGTERAHKHNNIPDELYGELFGSLLSRYRFTAREDSTSWSEAAIDPEMLGKAFESLMIPVTRHTSGAYYTPQAMVEQVTHAALLDALCQRSGLPADQVDAGLRGQEVRGEARTRLYEAARTLRVVDPACGSGAFLVHALERLSALLGNTGETRATADVRASVLATSIFGVDVNPMAVWLCELRLWLSIVIDSEETDPRAVPPLPNLDHNILPGDSLAAGGVFSASAPVIRRNNNEDLRARYMRATGHRKQTLRKQLDRLQRKRAIALCVEQLGSVTEKRRDMLAGERSRDLFGDMSHRQHARPAALVLLGEKSRRLRDTCRRLERGGALPFAYSTHFPEATDAGGFDVVLGNPPWVRLERIPEEARATMRREFDVFRLPLWEPANLQSRANRSFAAQVDMAALFVERSLSLARPGGSVALILPAKLWRSLAGSGLRQLLTRDATIVELQDWSDSQPAFDAVVYPSVLVVHRNDAVPRSEEQLLATLHTRGQALRWSLAPRSMPFDAAPGAPWLLVPPEVREAFNLLAACGVKLADSTLGVPRLGVKSGLNDAFIVNVQQRDASRARVHSGPRMAHVEASLLRPLVRGETVERWRTRPPVEHIIWTHGSDGMALKALPPLGQRWFNHWRLALSRRVDLKDSVRWWSLFRTECARQDCWRVVWADIGRAPRAALLSPQCDAVPLNSCYVAALTDKVDAYALTALLNSPPAAAWLNVLAEQARGGYRRYFAWTVALLPIPREWDRARELLAPLCEAALSGRPPSDAELLEAALRSYGVPHQSLAPLLTWNSR